MDMKIALGFLFTILQGQQPGGGSFLFSMLPFIIIFGIFYFLLIRPQQKRQRQIQIERDAMLNALKPGDKVITTGGIYGAVVGIRDNKVQLRIAQGVSIDIQREAIAGLQTEGKETEAVK